MQGKIPPTALSSGSNDLIAWLKIQPAYCKNSIFWKQLRVLFRNQLVDVKFKCVFITLKLNTGGLA